ncbi:MAG: ATP-binding protein [Gemmatimonadota bacterium]|nr:ATP-binding protein [Gemmatimonadota bacterium]
MRRSLRFELASRYAGAVAVGITLVAAIGYLVLRDTLDTQIDASLISVASIQASSVTADPTGRMSFHEWNVTAEESALLGDLNRYAQIWSESGQSLVRSQYLSRDLPVEADLLMESAAGTIAWDEGHLGETRVRSVYYPLGRLGARHERHILQVAAPLSERDRTLRVAGFFLAGVVFLVSVVSFLGSWWLADKTVRPVNEIIAQAGGIRGVTPGQRISAYAETREFASLVRVLNTMLARIDEAFEAQRRFTADASHELRSPLTALRGELELALRRKRTDEEYRRAIASALEEATRLSQVTADLLTLARSDAGVITLRLETVDLGERIGAAIDRLRGRIAEKSVTVRVSNQGGATGLYDSQLMDRLIWNLLDNAVKYCDAGGTIDVSISTTEAGLDLEVVDTGPGIPEEALARVFERFSRADDTRSAEGTGLGLSIVRAIATAHGGDVVAANRNGRGAIFRVRLPRTA